MDTHHISESHTHTDTETHRVSAHQPGENLSSASRNVNLGYVGEQKMRKNCKMKRQEYGVACICIEIHRNPVRSVQLEHETTTRHRINQFRSIFVVATSTIEKVFCTQAKDGTNTNAIHRPFDHINAYLVFTHRHDLFKFQSFKQLKFN